MKTVEIKCDGCGADLTSTGNCVDYRLSLENENIPTRGGFVTSMGAYPAIDRNCHFCDLRCLDLWTDRRRHRNQLWKDWNEKWKEEHGTKHENMLGNGKFTWSYPVPPDDVRKARDAEFDAAALEAYPIAAPPRS